MPRYRTPPALNKEPTWIYVVSRRRRRDGVHYMLRMVKRQLVTLNAGLHVRYDGWHRKVYPSDRLEKQFARAKNVFYLGWYSDDPPPRLPFIKLWLAT